MSENQSNESIEDISQQPSSQRELISRHIESREIDPTELSSLIPSVGEKLTLSERQEVTRSKLATFLIWILAGTLTASFSLILLLIIMTTFVDERKATNLEKTSTLVKDLITFILTAQTGLIGTALGFYFGSKNND